MIGGQLGGMVLGSVAGVGLAIFVFVFGMPTGGPPVFPAPTQLVPTQSSRWRDCRDGNELLRAANRRIRGRQHYHFLGGHDCGRGWTHPKHLRAAEALGEKPEDHQYIVTVPARGYRFVAEVRAGRGTFVSSDVYQLSAQEQDRLWWRLSPRRLAPSGRGCARGGDAHICAPSD